MREFKVVKKYYHKLLEEVNEIPCTYQSRSDRLYDILYILRTLEMAMTLNQGELVNHRIGTLIGKISPNFRFYNLSTDRYKSVYWVLRRLWFSDGGAGAILRSARSERNRRK